MEDLMSCLYNFVLENRMDDMVADLKYQAHIQKTHQYEEKLRAHLDEEQWQVLDTLIHEIYTQNSMENERIFQEALRLARELRTLA